MGHVLHHLLTSFDPFHMQLVSLEVLQSDIDVIAQEIIDLERCWEFRSH